MKKLIFIISIFFNLLVYGQSPKIILDEKFDDKDFLKSFRFLPKSDKVLVIRGLSSEPPKSIRYRSKFP